MTTDDRPSHHCQLATQADLSSVFDDLEIEHLPFDADRTYVIYDRAVFKLIVTNGQLTTARAFDTECWDAPAADPDAILTTFCDEILAATDSDRHVR